jgi:hypothetical protein
MSFLAEFGNVEARVQQMREWEDKCFSASAEWARSLSTEELKRRIENETYRINNFSSASDEYRDGRLRIRAWQSVVKERE